MNGLVVFLQSVFTWFRGGGEWIWELAFGTLHRGEEPFKKKKISLRQGPGWTSSRPSPESFFLMSEMTGFFSYPSSCSILLTGMAILGCFQEMSHFLPRLKTRGIFLPLQLSTAPQELSLPAAMRSSSYHWECLPFRMWLCVCLPGLKYISKNSMHLINRKPATISVKNT